MKQHFIFKSFILFVLAFLLVVPVSIQAAQPQDDNTSPYFENAAVRDSFKNCKKPIWTNNWVPMIIRKVMKLINAFFLMIPRSMVCRLL